MVVSAQLRIPTRILRNDTRFPWKEFLGRWANIQLDGTTSYKNVQVSTCEQRSPKVRTHDPSPKNSVLQAPESQPKSPRVKPVDIQENPKMFQLQKCLQIIFSISKLVLQPAGLLKHQPATLTRYEKNTLSCPASHWIPRGSRVCSVSTKHPSEKILLTGLVFGVRWSCCETKNLPGNV